jgi:hypothetical protein
MKSMQLIMIRTVIVSSFAFLGSVTGFTQQKRMLLPEDYALWEKASHIKESQLSCDGRWIYYAIKFVKDDSVFVRNVSTSLEYRLALSSIPRDSKRYMDFGSWNFSSNSAWFAVNDRKSVCVIHLASGKRKWFNANKFSFINNNRILLNQKDTSVSRVIIHDLKSGMDCSFNNVTAFELNPDGSKLAIAIDSAGWGIAKVVTFTEKITTRQIATAQAKAFNAFTWNKTGSVLAFIERPNGANLSTAADQIYVNNLQIQKTTISRFTPADLINVNDQKRGNILEMIVSDDGRQLFFEVEDTKFIQAGSNASKNSHPKPVQIWGATALTIPPEDQNYYATYWYAWHADGHLETLEDSVFSHAFLSGDQQQLMQYNKRRYLPQHLYVNGYIDLYLKDRQMGTSKLLAEKIKDQPSELLTSPTGQYISYFKEKKWWVYDFATNTHRCISQNIPANWEIEDHGSTGNLEPYGSPGWLKNDKAMLLYDQYDIWVVNADGTNPRKITNGRKDEITFRLAYKKKVPQAPGNQQFTSSAVDGREGVLLSSHDYRTLQNGLWWWSEQKGLTKLLSKDKKIELQSNAEQGKPLIFIESDFDVSPRLVVRHPSGKEDILYQTNPQQEQFYWGKSRVLRYQTADGRNLSGALLFPANYDPMKTYPMVVEVYEKRSGEAHDYIDPSASTDKSSETINPTVYTTQGYFVLFPDITYRVNDLGMAATSCVVAAVQTAINSYPIDKNRVGLTGHSFGGYETAFIISQTDIFRTAIVGSAVTDLLDFYLGISAFGPNLTRVEGDQSQYRTTVPFYSEAFNRNSPMHNIENIHTPLLLYTGQADRNVDWTQSRRFQIALWRLGKKSTMLVYPEEQHVLHKPENRQDLARRMKEWFDYYLKNAKPADWIKTNMGISEK